MRSEGIILPGSASDWLRVKNCLTLSSVHVLHMLWLNSSLLINQKIDVGWLFTLHYIINSHMNWLAKESIGFIYYITVP